MNTIDFKISSKSLGGSEIVGQLFEELLNEFASYSGRIAGEYFTPHDLSKLIVTLLKPKEGDQICDPVCGSGSLLIHLGKSIKSNYLSNKYELFGQEVNRITWALSVINMVIHEEQNFNLEWGNSIKDPKYHEENGTLKKYDLVVGVPPFSLSHWGRKEFLKDDYGRFPYGLPSDTSGDYVFVQHMIHLMKPETGKMAVVLPFGALFRGGLEQDIRKGIIEDGLIDSIISLPPKLLLSTGIPCVIMILSRLKKNEEIYFLDASNQFQPTRTKNILSEKNIKWIDEQVSKKNEIKGHARKVSLDEVKIDDYNLNPNRYLEISSDTDSRQDLENLNYRKELRNSIINIDNQIEKLIDSIQLNSN